jgi:hypothetical protein
MDKYTATELAFKNGYEKGYEAGKKSATDNKVGDKWVPTEERLPEIFGEFIVAVQDADGKRCSDYADYDPYQKRWRTGMYLGVRDKVTHWMPLPAPPKEG